MNQMMTRSSDNHLEFSRILGEDFPVWLAQSRNGLRQKEFHERSPTVISI